MKCFAILYPMPTNANKCWRISMKTIEEKAKKTRFEANSKHHALYCTPSIILWPWEWSQMAGSPGRGQKLRPSAYFDHITQHLDRSGDALASAAATHCTKVSHVSMAGRPAVDMELDPFPYAGNSVEVEPVPGRSQSIISRTFMDTNIYVFTQARKHLGLWRITKLWAGKWPKWSTTLKLQAMCMYSLVYACQMLIYQPSRQL